MTLEQFYTWMLGGLTEQEWKELVALEYVLTWNYTDNHKRDEDRHRELSDRCWEGRDKIDNISKLNQP